MISKRSGNAKAYDAADESSSAQTKAPNPINKRASALAILRSGEEPSASVLEKLGLKSYEDLLQSVANELKLPRLEIDSIELDPGLAELLPKKTAERHQIVPIFSSDDEI